MAYKLVSQNQKLNKPGGGGGGPNKKLFWKKISRGDRGDAYLGPDSMLQCKSRTNLHAVQYKGQPSSVLMFCSY